MLKLLTNFIVKDHTKIMGFATNRVVGKNLNKGGLSSVQMKGMSTLQNICGVKKTDEKIDQNALLKINALKNAEGPKKSKLLSDLDELPAKNENGNQPEKSMKILEKAHSVTISENMLSDEQIGNDNISLSSASTTASLSNQQISNSSITTTNATNATNAAPKKKPGFSLKNLI